MGLSPAGRLLPGRLGGEAVGAGEPGAGLAPGASPPQPPPPAGAAAVDASGRRKRSWSRAVFSNLQRKGLERRFLVQKYITKPDRRQLAATLGLTDAQVS